MVTVACPWCEDDGLFALAEIDELETGFTCADCGTAVAIVEDPALAVDPATPVRA